MRDLRLVAVSPEGTHLILEDGDQQQYRLRHDDRLTAVLHSNQVRSRQLESLVDSSLTPRDIQARIRAGQSPAEVAAAAGMPAARVERYASPVLAEREHVVVQARSTASHRHGGGPSSTLGEIVDARLAEQGVDDEAVTWDAWRVEDDRWTVRLIYLARARERIAEWVFDPRGRVLSPANDEARWVVDELVVERVDEEPAARVRRLSSVPSAEPGGQPRSSDDPGPDGSPDEVYDHEADLRRAAAERAAALAESAGAAQGGSAHAARSGRAAQSAHGGRRPTVPSWDDIMFGARKRD